MKYIAVILILMLAWSSVDLAAQDYLDGQEEEETQAEPEPEDERQRRGVRRLGDVVGEGSEEWSMDIPDMDVPASAGEPQPQVSLPDPDQDARLQALLTRRAFVPQDPEIQAGLEALMDEVQADAQAALNAGNLELAQQLVSVIAEFTPNRAVVNNVRAEITRRASVADTLAQADAALAAGELVTPPGQSAIDLYEQVLALEPGNQAASDGLVNTHQAILAQALELGRELDFESAEALLARAEDIHDDPDAVRDARASISDFRAGHIADLDRSAVAAIDAGQFDAAEGMITRLVALGQD
jgi:tetratricopeptide (TPR) repeat protein